jgi:hypothetical protein
MAETEPQAGAVQSEKENKAEATHEPTTNRVWDQSEHDRALTEALRAEREKYSDYDEVKSKLTSLLDEKEKQELSEKTELEKREHELSKIKQQLEEKDGILSQFKLKEIRDGVLSDPKYKELPAVYKNAINLSENEAEVQTEADKVLDQFNADFNRTGQSFGKATEKKPPDTKPLSVPKDADDLRASLKSRMAGIRF